LAPLKSAISTTPTSDFVGSNDYITAMQIEAGCSGLSIAACHQSPDGVLGREAYSAKSSYVDAVMTSAQVALNVEAVVNLKSHAPSIGGGLAFDAYGGVINRVSKDATAFVHRDKLACIQASYSWSSYTDAAEIAAGQEWLTWLADNVFDVQSGAYQNYIDPTLSNWQDAYYGSNLGRLAVIKKKYDPNDVFSFAQSIPRHV
jgi:Berberine and berberine like